MGGMGTISSGKMQGFGSDGINQGYAGRYSDTLSNVVSSSAFHD